MYWVTAVDEKAGEGAGVAAGKVRGRIGRVKEGLRYEGQDKQDTVGRKAWKSSPGKRVIDRIRRGRILLREGQGRKDLTGRLASGE